MPKPLHEMSTWDASTQTQISTVPAEDWEPTRVQTAMATQLAHDQDDYLADAAHEIGRRIDDRQHEMFVSCGAAEALQQQFDKLRPEYIVVHDVGASSSRRLVAGLAAACACPVQKLTIRRQGFGVSLAGVEFVELPTGGGRTLRVYTTEIDADTHARQEMSRVLMAYSRLGVLMVGDLPSHALASALRPLADAIRVGPWLNRDLLLLPLASASSIAAQAASLGASRGVAVRTTPQVARPADAWNYICGTWSRLRESLAANAGVSLPELGAGIASAKPLSPAKTVAPAVPSAPLAMQPMPALVKIAPDRASGASSPAPARAAVADAASPAPDPMKRYVDRLLEINGMVSACVFELSTQRPLMHAGSRPGPAMLAIQGSVMAGAIAESSRVLGFGAAPPEAAISLGTYHLILRPVPGRPSLMLHAVFDKNVANLTQARLQVLKLDSVLEQTTPA